MTRISQWAVRHPWLGLASWLLVIVLIGVLYSQFKGDYNDNFNLPDSESTTAQDMLSDLAGGAGTGSGLEGQIVWRADSRLGVDAGPAAAMGAVISELAALPGVVCVISPLGEPQGAACPAIAAPPGAGEGGQEQPELPPEGPRPDVALRSGGGEPRRHGGLRDGAVRGRVLQ